MKKMLKPAYQCDLFDLATDADDLNVDLIHLRALLAVLERFFGTTYAMQKELIEDETESENLSAIFYLATEQLSKIMNNASTLRDGMYEKLQEERKEA